MRSSTRQQGFQEQQERFREAAEHLYARMPVEDKMRWDEAAKGRRFLSRRAMRVWQSFAEAILDDGKGTPTPQQLAWFSREMDDFQASSRGISRAALLVLPWLLETAPTLSGTHLLPFSWLSKEQRQRCVMRMEEGWLPQLGLLAFMAKTLVCTVFFEHPDAQASMDVDGRCLVDEQREREMRRELLH